VHGGGQGAAGGGGAGKRRGGQQRRAPPPPRRWSPVYRVLPQDMVSGMHCRMPLASIQVTLECYTAECHMSRIA
jgi:hypothetical protein